MAVCRRCNGSGEGHGNNRYCGACGGDGYTDEVENELAITIHEEEEEEN